MDKTEADACRDILGREVSANCAVYSGEISPGGDYDVRYHADDFALGFVRGWRNAMAWERAHRASQVKQAITTGEPQDAA